MVSLPEIFAVILDVMVREHLQVLILKTLLVVMFHLLFDVINHGIHLRTANRKCAVAILPMKWSTPSLLVVDMLACTCLELSHEISDGDFSWNAEQ